jgi:tetratricopeptide (TPR) repeat protein
MIWQSAPARRTRRPRSSRPKLRSRRATRLRARAVYATVWQREASRARAANRRAATAARYVAAFDALQDTATALMASQSATELDPYDPEGWPLYASLLQRAGRTDGAREAYRRALDLTDATRDARVILIAQSGLGDIAVIQGDLSRATDHFDQMLRIARRLTDARPEAPAHLRNLSISLTRSAMCRARGAIWTPRSRPTRTGSPSARGWPRRIRATPAGSATSGSASTRSATCSAHGQSGRRARGLPGRARHPRELAARDPSNTEWQRDLIVSNVKLAEIAEEASTAERHYQATLEIAVALRDSGRLAPVDGWLVGKLEARLERRARTRRSSFGGLAARAT